ncbi:unnamed protein product [Rotaria sordida]|uniref:Uncharacterized protein n=1 Tax=Rotaria sordida TaxID=392033 RepID=A0A813PZR0_9BILA|nr:unnamed protein product [Rotaria sordida]
MLYYAVFTAFAMLAIGSNGKPTISKANEPKRCCIPKQFSAQISTSHGVKLPDGTITASYAYYNISYDGNRGMVGLKGVSFSIPDQQQSNLWIIENRNDGQIYTIDQGSKQCQKSQMPIQPLSCIPGIQNTATYLHSSTYGYGDKQIIGDTWLVTNDNIVNYATVSRDDLCVPLSGHIFLPSVLTALTTTDFTLKIDDPSIFNIPAECQNAV